MADVAARPFWGTPSCVHPWRVINRPPTPQDLLELSARVYKSTHRLYNEADSQGMRVMHDELIAGDVRLVMLLPSWFPKAHVRFDWDRLTGDTVSVVLVLRGTMQDLVGNTKANLQLLYNKLLDDHHLPDVAADATKVIQAWLQQILLRHPELDMAAAGAAGAAAAAADEGVPGLTTTTSTGRRRQLHLDVHLTGHSLGGMLAGVATVESHSFAAAHGMTWQCTAFEDPGLPEIYHRAAARQAPGSYWDRTMTSYLAAPNAINMLNLHLGHVVHVVVPWEHTWSHVVKCVGADVARVTAWAIVAGMAIAATKQVSGFARQQQEEQQGEGGAGPRAALGEAGGLAMQQCHALLPQLAGVGGSNSSSSSHLAAAAAAAGGQPIIFSVAEGVNSGAAVAAAAPQMRRLASISLSNVALAPAASAMPAAAAGAITSAASAASASGAAAAQGVAAAAVGAAAAAGEAAASFGGGRIIHTVARHSGLGVLANAIGGLFLGRRGLSGALECLAGVLGVEIEELIAQHALGPMRQCFDPHTGQLKAQYCRKMASWPMLGRRGEVVLTAAKQVAKWTLPSFVCRDNMGLANMMSRTAMVEARCARLKGYVVLDNEADIMEVHLAGAATLTTIEEAMDAVMQHDDDNEEAEQADGSVTTTSGALLLAGNSAAASAMDPGMMEAAGNDDAASFDLLLAAAADLDLDLEDEGTPAALPASAAAAGGAGGGAGGASAASAAGLAHAPVVGTAAAAAAPAAVVVNEDDEDYAMGEGLVQGGLMPS